MYNTTIYPESIVKLVIRKDGNSELWRARRSCAFKITVNKFLHGINRIRASFGKIGTGHQTDKRYPARFLDGMNLITRKLNTACFKKPVIGKVSPRYRLAGLRFKTNDGCLAYPVFGTAKTGKGGMINFVTGRW